MSRLLEALPPFSNSSRPEPWCSRPFAFRHNHTEWSIATDGVWLLAVPGKSPFKPLVEPPDVASLLKLSPKNSIVAPVPELLKWAGPAPSYPPSPSFGRDSSPDHDGVVVGVAIDRRRLSYILGRLDEKVPEVSIWNTTGSLESRSIAIFAQHWRIYMAGVDCDASPELPQFPPVVSAPASTEESLFDLAMTMGDP